MLASLKTPQGRRAAAIAAALTGLQTLALLGCTTLSSPPELEPPAGAVHTTTLAARGVQIYECRNGTGGYAWAFVAPDAQLYDNLLRRVGDHGAGPSWQVADGSRIVGTVQKRTEAPRAGDIPWLLLATKSTGTSGHLSKVTSVQRINTEGGVAPAQGCDAAHAGAVARVAYRADYRFYATH
jgi:hypothetical protein